MAVLWTTGGGCIGEWVDGCIKHTVMNEMMRSEAAVDSLERYACRAQSIYEVGDSFSQMVGLLGS